MMFILMTFPGIILKKILQIIIYKYYDRVTCQHVIAHTLSQSICIVLFPFLINSIICAMLIVPFSIAMQSHYVTLDHNWRLIDFLCVWIGGSVGCHTIPTENDLDPIIKSIYIQKSDIWLNKSIKLIRFCTEEGMRPLSSIGYTALLLFLVGKLLI